MRRWKAFDPTKFESLLQIRLEAHSAALEADLTDQHHLDEHVDLLTLLVVETLDEALPKIPAKPNSKRW